MSSQRGGVVFRKTFDTSVDGADKAYEIENDLSRCKTLLVELKLTKIATDATDFLDVSLEMTSDNVKWHRRLRFKKVAGNAASASATNPKYFYATLSQSIPACRKDEVYEGDGGVSATALPSGAVINGPFLGRLRQAKGARINSWRVHLVVTDGGTQNADYEGTITVWDVSEEE